jgi:transcriptional regulator with XRE-family HTH domain
MISRKSNDTNETAMGLFALGATLRETRKAQKVSAVALSEAAGLSRVTLHRIERGEPGVAIGSLCAVAAALGLRLGLAPVATEALTALPENIPLDAYPVLRQLAWQIPGVTELEPSAALALYERNWRHVDPDALSPKESVLISQLMRALGGGRLLV